MNLRAFNLRILRRAEWIPFFIAAAFFAGCGQRNVTITGQAFIVSDSQSIKLGLVEVYLIEEKAAKAFLTTWETRIEKERLALKQAQAKAKAEWAVATAAWSAFETNASYLHDEALLEQVEREIVRSIVQTTDAAVRNELYAKRGDLEERIKGSKKLGLEKLKDFQSGFKRSSEIHKALLKTYSPNFYFESDLPQLAFAKTTTDADGRFSILCPKKGKIALLSRTPDAKHAWFFWLPVNRTEPILLSNDKLATSDYPFNLYRRLDTVLSLRESPQN